MSKFFVHIMLGLIFFTTNLNSPTPPMPGPHYGPYVPKNNEERFNPQPPMPQKYYPPPNQQRWEKKK